MTLQRLRQALEGGKYRGEVPAEWITWKLVKLTGWTVDQIDEAPGHLLRWFLEFDRIEGEAQDAIAKRERDAAGRS